MGVATAIRTELLGARIDREVDPFTTLAAKFPENPPASQCSTAVTCEDGDNILDISTADQLDSARLFILIS